MSDRAGHETTFDHIRRNQDAWTDNAADYVTSGRRNWSAEPSWGIWKIADAQLGLLAGVRGADVVELGCGTGYISAWIKRLGGRPIGVDPTPNQLSSARLFQREFDLGFPLVRAGARSLTFVGAARPGRCR